MICKGTPWHTFSQYAYVGVSLLLLSQKPKFRLPLAQAFHFVGAPTGRAFAFEDRAWLPSG